ncbi:hypothetical protein FWC31_03870 [Candidatus Saccharibacteria bacterium]|nr:hypothetical protein [Candidatus Saccharibacteria bacterium]
MRILFICQHNLGRSQIAQAFFNHLTDTNNAKSVGTSVGMYPEKTLGEFKEETRATKVMREVGLDLTKAPLRQITPASVRGIGQIISFVSRAELPEWLQNDARVQIWLVKNYPAQDMETVRRQRDEILRGVRKLVKTGKISNMAQ